MTCKTGKRVGSGLTLLELMLALASSLFLLLALTGMFCILQKNFASQHSLNQIQENANVAVRILRQAMQQAGNIGCAKLMTGFPLKTLADYGLTVSNKLQGSDDSLMIRGARVENAGVIKNMKDEKNIIVATSPLFAAGDVAMIADCKTAEIFIVNYASLVNQVQQHIQSTTALAKTYDETASVSLFDINTYLIEPTSRPHTKALYVINHRGRKTELVEGIDTLLFTYDVKQLNSVQTLRAYQVSDWASVVGVHVVMTLRHGALTKQWRSYLAL